tara:strand:+ start:969 stop:1277 length:309 start_codon:yes stop_codon:yes gene_type:complete
MKRNTKDLSPQVIQVYNTLLDLAWHKSQITIDHAIAATGLGRSVLALVLKELESQGLLLVGMEDSLDSMIQTFTPIVKGGAYVYPCDDFKIEVWQAMKLDNS